MSCVYYQFIPLSLTHVCTRQVFALPYTAVAGTFKESYFTCAWRYLSIYRVCAWTNARGYPGMLINVGWIWVDGSSRWMYYRMNISTWLTQKDMWSWLAMCWTKGAGITPSWCYHHRSTLWGQTGWWLHDGHARTYISQNDDHWGMQSSGPWQTTEVLSQYRVYWFPWIRWLRAQVSRFGVKHDLESY